MNISSKFSFLMLGIVAALTADSQAQTNGLTVAGTTVNVTASGGTPPTYQWYKPGGAVSVSPTDWIDPDTGHHVVQLSTEPVMRGRVILPEAFLRDIGT